MTCFAKRSLLCTLILAGLAGCSGGDLAADSTAAGAASGTAASALSGMSSEKAVIKAASDTAEASGAWSRVGGEWDTVTVPANSTVRYGANGSYVQKTVSGTFQATNDFFGSDPVPGVVKSVEVFTPAAAATTTSAASVTWSRIGGEWDTVTVPANSTVRYGANGSYVQKVVSGTFRVTNDFFGIDPLPGVVKSVELQSSASGNGSAATPATTPAASTPAASTPAMTAGTWSRVGGEWDTVTVPANSTVRYGANGSYVQKAVSGTFQATNAFFGSDPAPGIVKAVELLSGATGSAAAETPAATTPPASANSAAAAGRVLSVGPGKAYARVADAAAAAQNGDTVEISAGTYYGDVATWRQNNLTIRGVGGRPVLDANGVSAQGKGIFVISGSNVTIENLEFANAKVPDLNGAGIRMEGGSLVVRNSVFRNNEDSFITTPDENATLEVYDSQFLNNGFWYTNGLAHGIYINRIGRLTIQGSYFTGTQAGHLIKSRAKESRILYNRITDEQGAASYQADFPDGGTVYLIGNIIEKNVNPQNPSVISYGLENRVWASNDIHVANNTIISRRGGGCRWIQAASWSTVRWTNNVQVGNNCDYSVPSGTQQVNNFLLSDGDFANAAGYDFRLRAGSSAVGRKVDAGSVNGMSLTPVREYQHVATSNALGKPATSPGAFQTAY